MIHDVKIKKLKLIPDDRGFLMEMLRCDDEVFKGFGQVYMTGCKRGIVKGWHYHKEQTDNFVCVYGKALVVLCDFREGSPTHGESNEFYLDGPPEKGEGNMLLQIPVGVMHGFTAFECDEARIVNVPTRPYKYDKPDEYRFPWNSEEIPYKWPEFVKSGG